MAYYSSEEDPSEFLSRLHGDLGDDTAVEL